MPTPPPSPYAYAADLPEHVPSLADLYDHVGTDFELSLDVKDPAAFDAAKINAMIAASTLDDATKATLKAGVDAAATNPALVQGAIDAVKAAMGM